MSRSFAARAGVRHGSIFILEGKLGRNTLRVQSTVERIKALTAAETATTDPADLALEGDLADARDYNLVAPDIHATAAGLPYVPQPGDIIRGKTVYGLTGDWDPTRPGDNNVRTQIDFGTTIGGLDDGVITYGFFDHVHAVGINNNPKYDGAALGEGQGYTPFTEAQRAAARLAAADWDELIAPEFREVSFGESGASGWAQSTADIWLANTYTGPGQAWAYIPTGGNGAGARLDGDVWTMDPRFNVSNLQFDPGFYGRTTLVHELGHSLGLTHPGDYDAGDDDDGDGVADPITYVGDAFFFQDNRQYSIMSYFDPYDIGSATIDWNLMRFVYGSTPMVDDIWIIQQKYGAEMTTRTGDTTYGFNATDDVTNEAMRFEDGEMHTVFAIWDADGNDTLDLSGYYTPSIIDLREGAYSSAGGLGAYDPAWVGVDPTTLTKEDYLAFVNANNAALFDDGHTLFTARTGAYDLYFGGRAGVNEEIPWSDIVGRDWLMENNIGIAYGATIENAIGGHGNDRINGNQVDNQLTGGGGADTFVIADYSTAEGKTTMDGQTFDDESVDTIMDFQTGVDKIDLTELGVTWADLSVSGNTWTVERGDDDLSFVVLGTAPVEADFVF